MSRLAEFARDLHESGAPVYPRLLEAADCPSRMENLGDVKAVVFDVYGTLINYWRPGFDDAGQRSRILIEALRRVADRFGLTAFLADMDPGAEPEKTLYDLYHGCIALCRPNAAKKGAGFPETKVEDVWEVILLMLERRGFDAEKVFPGVDGEIARYLAYAYNFFSLGRELYPGVVDALAALKKKNIVLGIVSTAQFYTPIDLTLLIRDQSRGVYDDFNELFEPDLTFFSCECSGARQGETMFRPLCRALLERRIIPEQTIFAGNDLVKDIGPAAEAGMRTAMFTGDRHSALLHGRERTIVPDMAFATWDELPRKVSKEKGTA